MRPLMKLAIRCLVIGATMGVAPELGSLANAQTGSGVQREIDPRLRTMASIMQPISVELRDVPLEEFVRFIETIADITVEPYWESDRADIGLRRESLVSVTVEEVPIVNLIERVLNNVAREDFEEATWQLSRFGELEIGHKSRLNSSKTRRVYYVLDLITGLANFNSAPDLSLDQILGGQGGGSPFEDADDDDDGWPSERADRDEQAEALMDLIRTSIEPDQWGSDRGPRMSFFNNSLIVTAPGYIHRQLGGSPFLPSRYAPYVGDEPTVHGDGGLDDGTAIAAGDAESDSRVVDDGPVDNGSRMR